MKKLAMASLIVALALAGCHKQPTLDASTPQTLKASSDAIRAGLSGNDLKRYDASVTSIIVARLDPITTINASLKAGAMPSQQGVFDQIKPAFNGKTLDDVYQDGKAAESTVRNRLSEWESRAGKLRLAQKGYEFAAGQAAKVVPVSADLRTLGSAMPVYGDNQVEVTVSLRNDTGSPLQAVEFNLGLMPPGVSTPWVVEPVKQDFATPLAAGETRAIKTRPIQVSIPDVYKGEIKLDADIEVTGLQPAGQAKMSVPRWDAASAALLAKYEAAIASVQQVLATVEGR